MIYALLSQTFVVKTNALFPKTFETEKKTPQKKFAFRMYGLQACPQIRQVKMMQRLSLGRGQKWREKMIL